MRDGYIVDILTSTDIQETIKRGRKQLNFMKKVFIERILNYQRLEKLVKKLFVLRPKYKDEGNDFMQSIVKIDIEPFIWYAD